MSRKAEASAMGMAERAEGAAGRKKKAGPVVYCGPTVRGVAKQYTVFSGGIPEALEDFIYSDKWNGLNVTIPYKREVMQYCDEIAPEQFAETRRKMETAGTAEAILYHKIKSEL